MSRHLISIAALVVVTFVLAVQAPATPVRADTSSLTFGFTGGVQYWTVPGGVDSVTIQAFGAEGGAGLPDTIHAAGGSVSATLPVSPGDELEIIVGGKGGDSGDGYRGLGGFNGGANGGRDGLGGNYTHGAGGGGASSVRADGTTLVVGGGGGGAGSYGEYAGGAGGGIGGANGARTTSLAAGRSGWGGTATAGGNGGFSAAAYCGGDGGIPGSGSNGSLGSGGAGGGGYNITGGGGGGGGYYGGGGGGAGCVWWKTGADGGGGGGGSGYADPSATNVSYSLGGHTGNGEVMITYSIIDLDGDGICDPGASTGVATICSGSDNCPSIPNPDQGDVDHDGIGDACDTDSPLVVTAKTATPVPETGWFPSSPVTVNIRATSGYGISEIDFAVDGGPETHSLPIGNPLVAQTSTNIFGDGEHTLMYSAIDTSGDVTETKTLIVRIGVAPLNVTAETKEPVPPIGWFPSGQPVAVDITASSGLGIDEIVFSVDGGAETHVVAIGNPLVAETTTNIFGDGEHTLSYRATDTSEAVTETKTLVVQIGEPDTDGDGVPDSTDNCPSAANADQADFDGDGHGDACDLDVDGDGVPNVSDQCAGTSLFTVVAADGCPDPDTDGVSTYAGDNCPSVANPDQMDTDNDGLGNACDPDDDNDGIADSVDTQPLVFSDAFNDVGTQFGGSTSGTILNRGDQELSVSDAGSPADGVSIAAGPGGGAQPAHVKVCGSTNYTLTPGDNITVTCGSSIVKVIAGPVEVEYFVDGRSVGTTTLNTGDELTFEPDQVSFNNTGGTEVVLVVNGQQVVLSPGETTLLTPVNKDACKHGGWETLFRSDGSLFKNQGDCIQYVNTGT